MVEIVILLPFAMGLLAFFMPQSVGRVLLIITGAVHLALSVGIWIRRPTAFLDTYFAVTAEGLLSLLVISLLFFLIAVYTRGYLKEQQIPSEPIFTGSMLLFLATMDHGDAGRSHHGHVDCHRSHHPRQCTVDLYA